MHDASPSLADNTLIEAVRLPFIIRVALIRAGLKTVGEVRAATTSELQLIPDIGANSVTFLRLTLAISVRDDPFDAV